MSQNLLEHTRSNRAFADLKQALREIGCDVCDIEGLADVPNAIRSQCCTGPNAVVNAAIMPGPGIKVTPIERKGYKISATDEAPISADLNQEYKKGTSIHKVLFNILNKDLPKAMQDAIRAPRIADIEVFKVYEDGIDYFQNAYFGDKGSGRRTGLHPNEWYIKIYTCAQVEPYYLSLAPMIEDLRKEILWEARREADKTMRKLLAGYHEKYHKNMSCSKHEHKSHKHHTNHFNRPDHSFGGYDPDDAFAVDPNESEDDGEKNENNNPVVIDQPISDQYPIIQEGTGNCPICDHDDSFGGYEGDDNFLIDGEDGSNDDYTDDSWIDDLGINSLDLDENKDR